MKMLKENNSGQALIELALVIPILLTFVFGLVDYSRAMYDMEVITNLAGEGGSLASRGTSPADTVTAVINAAGQGSGQDVNMSAAGCVIVTLVNNPNGSQNPVYDITDQATGGGASGCGASWSQIGQCTRVNGNCTGRTTALPANIQTVLNASMNTNIAITEMFFNFRTITPIGYFLHKSNWLPTQLYRVAYY